MLLKFGIWFLTAYQRTGRVLVEICWNPRQRTPSDDPKFPIFKSL